MSIVTRKSGGCCLRVAVSKKTKQRPRPAQKICIVCNQPFYPHCSMKCCGPVCSIENFEKKQLEKRAKRLTLAKK